ncbi:MAG: Lytic transglycosylase catalytic [Mycobacterium sp.]|nr:Lytic transglycosylase catalytic [Mycobacterium sp.]
MISQPAVAATAPNTDPSASSLNKAHQQVQTAAQQLASAEAEVRDATDQLQTISYEVVRLHNEQAKAEVALDSARADTRTAVRAAYEGATVDPTATLLADLSGKDPGLEDQVRDHRLADIAERTRTLQAAVDTLAVITKQAAARSVEAVKAAARAVSAANAARDGLAAAEKNNNELHQAAELAAQRKELEKLSKELEVSLASLAAGAAAGSSGIGVTAAAPADVIALYQRAAKTCPGLPWGVLAGIGQVETNHGQNKNISSAGAMGPMQFMPATFAVYGVDGDGDGIKDILDQTDAVFSAAHYLCANGGGDPERLYDAIYHYNHLDSYVREVLSLAAQYQAGKQPA